MIKHLHENIGGRDFVIGDLHGCYTLLMEHLKVLHFDKQTDRLFSVGDLIDRGPDSEKCLSLLSEPWFHAARGNHEEMLLTVTQQTGNWTLWEMNGGAWAKKCTSKQLSDYATSIKELPFVISVGDAERRFNVIHAEFYGTDQELDEGNFNEETRQILLWSRMRNWETHTQDLGLSPTFCGHTIQSQIKKSGSLINIDLGAFRSGQLAVVNVKSFLDLDS